MKKLSLSLLLLPGLLGCFTASSFAQTPAPAAPPAPATAAPATATAPDAQGIDPAKAAEIHKLLELTGTVKVTQRAIGQMIDMFKAQHPNMPDDFWAKAEKDIDVQELISKMVPLYDKYYSLDDLKAVNAFYSSPAGQRLVAVTPQLMSESMTIGQDWGQRVGAKIEADIKANTPPPAPAPTSAPASAPSTPAPVPAPAPAPAEVH